MGSITTRWVTAKEGAAGCVLLLALLVSIAFVPTASANLIVGSIGTGAGQYEKPGGVAVDTSNGDIYIADTENNRVDVFNEAGGFLFAFGWGVDSATPEEKLQICTTASGPGAA